MCTHYLLSRRVYLAMANTCMQAWINIVEVKEVFVTNIKRYETLVVGFVWPTRKHACHVHVIVHALQLAFDHRQTGCIH
jgi:hypothetical protein